MFILCAVGSLMSHSDSYDNYLRILPTASYEGHVLAHVIQTNFGWNRVVIFAIQDERRLFGPFD